MCRLLEKVITCQNVHKYFYLHTQSEGGRNGDKDRGSEGGEITEQKKMDNASVGKSIIC